MIYRRYIGCRAFPTRYCNSIVGWRKNRPKSVNITDISAKYQYIGDNVGLQHLLEFFKFFFLIFTDLSLKIDDISSIYQPCLINMAHMRGGRWGPCGFGSVEEKVECRDHVKGP